MDMRKVITTEMLNRDSPDKARTTLPHPRPQQKNFQGVDSRPDLTETGIQAVHIIERLLDLEEKAKFAVWAGTSTEAAKAETSGPPSSSGVVPPSKHATLTNMQKEELWEIFGESIDDGQMLPMSEVHERIKSVCILSMSTTFDVRMKQVVNYLNYEARKSSPSSVAVVETKVSSWVQKLDNPST